MFKIISTIAIASALVFGGEQLVPSPGGGGTGFAQAAEYKTKNCHIKKRCDYKIFVKKSEKKATLFGGPHGRGGSDARRPTRPDWHRGPVRPHGWGWGPRPRPHVVHHYDGGPNIIGALVGGVTGFIIGRATAPEPVEVERPGGGAIVLEPWSPEWYSYCAQKYKSFDGKTGTWTDNDGTKHFCR